MSGDDIPWDKLEAAARHAQSQAYAPYSNFAVGAALYTADKSIIPGCNVENASYGLTLCAERNAVASAIAQGMRDWLALLLIGPTEAPITPCGMCRQVLFEFAPDLPLRCLNQTGDKQLDLRVADLLPQAFSLS